MAGISSGVHAPYRVVRNGVDLRAWTHAREGDRKSARAELGLQPERPLAVCVGRLCKQKGQMDLVAAWPLVRSSVPDACLVLVGDGPDRALLEQRCTAAGGITLTGERHDVATWMAAADVVVVPSRWDGMALVVVEAMARGRSVVATSVPGIADAVPRSAGAVVPLDDGRAFAKALVARLHDRIRCDAEGAIGRLYVELNHDQAVSADAVVTIYDELLAHGRPGTPQPRASVLGGPARAGSEA
jgi:glycosyltransferase involved in cell wall biosynthesis